MTVKELKEILKDKADDLEVYSSRWTARGEVRQRMRLSRADGSNIAPSGKHVRISWTDDCRADTIFEDEYNGR